MRFYLSRPSAQPLAEHQNSHHDQNHRPELLDAPPRKPVKIVQQQQNADGDDEKRPLRLALAESLERIVQRQPRLLGLRGAKRIDRHVHPQRRDADPQSRFGPSAQRTIHSKNEKEKKNREMNYALAVLLVVECAESW